MDWRSGDYQGKIKSPSQMAVRRAGFAALAFAASICLVQGEPSSKLCGCHREPFMCSLSIPLPHVITWTTELMLTCS